MESSSETRLMKNILEFSDCVLTLILRCLKPYDLYRLSKTCQRFKYLIEERKLWKRLNVLEHPMCARKFTFFFENVNCMTDTIMVSGISRREKTLTLLQFRQICDLCENLTVLAIENQYINSDELSLKNFPETLKELSLRGTHIYGRQPFLQDANLKLRKLHTLILDDCKWFHEHSLMALSKLESLENLSLYKCGNLNDSVAYMSITAKFGFRKLLRIDARCTSIGDQFLKCFHCIKTLREIYLEAPQQRESKKKPLYDEIKRLCGDVHETSTAVVFNRNNIFKLRRDRVKKQRPPVSLAPTSFQALLKSQEFRGFNCVDNCTNCSIETCSLQQPPPMAAPSTLTSCDETGTYQEEVFVCDDVSDSDDEMVDFEIFHSDVTDSGVQWFCTSDPNAPDHLGNESMLFRKPYKECVCGHAQNDGAVDLNVPGPSREVFPGSSSLKRKRSLSPSSSGELTPPLKKKANPTRRFHNDVTLNVSGKVSVCLKIAYESSDDEDEDDEDDDANDGSLKRRSLGDAVLLNRQELSPPPPAHQVRGRDLRVIIERLDPGVHIVYDQVGNVQLDHLGKDYTTKLKVFIARGYKLITNHALRSLMDLRLELLDLTGTSVSAKGVREFLMVNPDCRVIHESTCSCN